MPLNRLQMLMGIFNKKFRVKDNSTLKGSIKEKVKKGKGKEKDKDEASVPKVNWKEIVQNGINIFGNPVSLAIVGIRGLNSNSVVLLGIHFSSQCVKTSLLSSLLKVLSELAD